jgi:dinuclear metal center YbgI/SA1388 family protein
MITRIALARYLQEHLNVDRFKDYAPNGLQVEGRETIARICTAVTASESAIQEALRQQADALLVHHGYFWRGEDPTIHGMKRRRLSLLMESDLNLFAYHLPLDCHLVLGNNARLATKLNAVDIQTHASGNIPDLLWSGALPQSMTAPDLSRLLGAALNRTPLHVTGTDKPIKRLAWCSGAAQDLIEEAAQLGVDAYLSGEISERTYYQAKELGIHYFSCGHHATERYGIQALGEHLHTKFGLHHQFIDGDNPV